MSNPPKPTEIKRRTGNPGRRPLPATPTAIVNAAESPPDAPHGVGEVGRKVWQRAWEVGASWLAPSDALMVEQAAQMVDDIAGWQAAIEAEGATYQTNSGMWRTHPGVAQVNVLRRELRATLSLLGFSPADRSRLGLSEVKTVSALADLMEKRRASLGR
ncbi:MAG: P27 family phage terminase small subunit [Candidatus Limnocylindria bacterium]